MKSTPNPETLQEAIGFFSNPNVAFEFVARLRWPDGIACPHCGATEPSFLSSRRIWKCKGCQRQFSVKVGTIFEDSPIGLDKWLPCLWMLVNCKNGISSYEIARALGVTQKTAWFMAHRVRLAMQTGTFAKMSGDVEVDETFIGGKARFMHNSKRRAKISGTGGKDKAAVMGLLQRHSVKGHSIVKVKAVPNVKRANIGPEVRQSVAEGSQVLHRRPALIR